MKEGRKRPSAVDLERYPLDRLTDPAGAALVCRCQDEIAQAGICLLPGFLKPEALTAIAREALACGGTAYHMEHIFAYGEGMPDAVDPESLAADDPRRYPIHTALQFVANDEIPQASLMRQVYEWERMLEFVRRVFRRGRLYRGSDRLNGLNYTVMGEGDEQDWHFDEHDFSVTVMLEQGAAGGLFEFVPRLRGPDGEDLGGLRKAIDGTHEGLIRLSPAPGTLSLFEGRYNYHRATKVKGGRKRLLALLQYVEEPWADDEAADAMNRLFFGRTAKEEPLGAAMGRTARSLRP
ncbi:MAG: hypothetical protein O7A65_01190 [Proteobacteria bacterium]|nr:hypothetical protein [Pseudomonadota bacterium]